MTELTLDDRTYEYDTDGGTWTRIRFEYGSPWSNGSRPDVTVWVDTFKRKPDGFCLKGKPDASTHFTLDEVNIALLAGYLGAVDKLLWHQWAQYDAHEKAEKP